MQRLNSEGISITRDEATELLSYHLAQAAIMFQCVPEDTAATPTRDEVLRTVARYVGNGDYNDPGVDASMAFYDTINARYEKMKEDD